MSGATPSEPGQDRVTLEDLRHRADTVSDLVRVRVRQGVATLAARDGARMAVIGGALVLLALAAAYRTGWRHGSSAR